MDPLSLMQKIGAGPAGPEITAIMSDEVTRLLSVDNHRPPRGFPGAQPVSFAAKHIKELMTRDYYVCEKTDGVRYLLYLTEGNENTAAAYLVDRKNDYYYVPELFLPLPDNPTFRNPDFTRFHTRTILDGELVLERLGNGKEEIKFFVFDCLIVDGKSLLERSLDKRLGYFLELIIKPYKVMCNKQPGRRRPFTVEEKNTEFSYAIDKMFKEIIPKIKRVHGNDGLIFTCRETGYKMGTDENILKWKPPHDNTVDFLMHIIWREFPPDPSDPDQSSSVTDYHAMPASFELYVFLGRDEYEFHSNLYLEPSEWSNLKSLGKPLQDSVVECYLEQPPQPNSEGLAPRWRFYRLRDDKLNANHVSVVEKVTESIEDAISEENLMAAQGEMRNAWKRRNAGGQMPSAMGDRRESRATNGS
ncbi:MAG: hypothetical protein Q9227_008697 [Pyrenula ochraceoflavens]